MNGTPSIPTQHEERSDSLVAHLEKAQIPCLNSTGGLTPLYNSRGKRSSMPKTETRPDFPVETGKEHLDPCCNWRGNLSFLPQLEMRMYSPAVTREEFHSAPHNLKKGLTSLRQQEGFPEVTVLIREEPNTSHCNPRNTTRFPPQCKMMLDSPAVTQEQSHATPHNSKGDLTSLRKHKRFPDVPMASWEES